ncbi:uncharacterized protein LOC115880703 [Sitophilus oryzae]|uniref:Uncharacterized protein LOC115880703 n=1 Tax=Sitophilus oryzae TaxID=7048 RepID=A0A6J2XQQ5_SITOR|nr:uncharacterized protein LOC115880703 [Sitophilus oryzae]
MTNINTATDLQVAKKPGCLWMEWIWYGSRIGMGLDTSYSSGRTWARALYPDVLHSGSECAPLHILLGTIAGIGPSWTREMIAIEWGHTIVITKLHLLYPCRRLMECYHVKIHQRSQLVSVRFNVSTIRL